MHVFYLLFIYLGLSLLLAFGEIFFALKVKEWGTMWDSRLIKLTTIPSVMPQAGYGKGGVYANFIPTLWRQ